jgi:hypothetical protein
MDRASLMNIALKTVFIVALATAQWRSELYMLYLMKRSPLIKRGRSNWHPCQASWRGTRRLTSLGVPLLSLSCQLQLIEPLMPSPGIKVLRRLNSTPPPTGRRGSQHLFILCTATISRWIVSKIKLAYQLTGNSQLLLRLKYLSPRG